MAVLQCMDIWLYIVIIFLIWDVGDLSAHSMVCILWNKLSKGHRGLVRGFFQGIRKPKAVWEHVSEADTKTFFFGLKVWLGAALYACCCGSPQSPASC